MTGCEWTPVRAPRKLLDALGGMTDGKALAVCTGGLETEVGADGLFQAGHLRASQAAPAAAEPELGDGVQVGRVGVALGVLGQARLGAQRNVGIPGTRGSGHQYCGSAVESVAVSVSLQLASGLATSTGRRCPVQCHPEMEVPEPLGSAWMRRPTVSETGAGQAPRPGMLALLPLRVGDWRSTRRALVRG